MSSIFALIEATSCKIKHKTIDFVKVLRQHSIPASLEHQIEAYLTDVLDQMDLLMNINNDKAVTSLPSYENEGGRSF